MHVCVCMRVCVYIYIYIYIVSYDVILYQFRHFMCSYLINDTSMFQRASLPFGSFSVSSRMSMPRYLLIVCAYLNIGLLRLNTHIYYCVFCLAMHAISTFYYI